MTSTAPRALVADDEGMVSMLIEDILADRGYVVSIANARVQLDAALADPAGWSLVVIDTDLATYDEIKSWNVDHIVLCTGRPADELTDRFPNIPYVSKPCSAEDFDAVLGRSNARADSDNPSSGATP